MPTDRGPAILIGGVGRIGKTRLADKLASRTGFDVIQCDRLRWRFWSMEDGQKRSAERFRCYEEAIVSRRGGLIIEGDDLISRNRGEPGLAIRGLIPNDDRPSVELLKRLKDQLGANPFVVGCIKSSPATWFAAIRGHDEKRTFTSTLSDERLKTYINQSLHRSTKLRTMAAEDGISYLDLGGENFDGAIDAAATRILDEVGWSARPSFGPRSNSFESGGSLPTDSTTTAWTEPRPHRLGLFRLLVKATAKLSGD